MTMRSGPLRRWLPALIALAFVLTTIPTFFAGYRAAAFQTSPRDDYAPLLLSLTGEHGDLPARLPTVLGGAPFGYRFLSVIPAIPFYHVLPYYPFSNLPNPDEHYLRAVAALTLVSYLAMLLTTLVIFLIARRRLRCSPAGALIAAFLAFGLFQFVGIDGVDPLAVLVISLLIYSIDRAAIFAPLVVVSAVMNEKVAIIFALLFAFRFIAWAIQRSSPFRWWPQLVGTGAAVLVYAVMRLVILRLPGYENQTDPGTFLSGAISTIRLSLSLKGLVQNGIPLMVVGILLVVAFAAWRRDPSVVALSDLAVAPALLAVGVMINMEYTVGRLVMHSFPLYLPFLAFFLDDYLVGRSIAPSPFASTEGAAAGAT